MVEYTNTEIAQTTGLTKRKVQFLVDVGVIQPKERGRGKPIIYSEVNLIEIVMTQILQEKHKIEISAIGRMLAQLHTLIRERRYKGFATEDFFTNDFWGKEKEILYCEAFAEGGNLRMAIDPVDVDFVFSEEIMKHVIRPANQSITSVCLGKVKIEAIKRLKIKG